MPVDQPKPGAPAIDIPLLKDWKARTSAGTLTSRHSKLIKVDESIDLYHNAVDMEARDRALAKLFMDFFKYKDSHKAWKTDPRNKTHGELQKLDDFLNAWIQRDEKQLSEATIPLEEMIIWRQGVCFALSKLEVVGYYDLTWENIKHTSVSGYNGITAVNKAVNKAVDVAAGKHIALDGGVVSSVTDSIKEFLSHLAGSHSNSGDSSHLTSVIVSGLPEILKNIGGAIASTGLAPLAIVAEVRKAVKAAMLYHNTADLGAGVHEGSPRDIVESVRSQTFEKIMTSIKTAIKKALSAVAHLIPFGALIDAFRAVYEFISALWYHYKEREIIQSILIGARDRYGVRIYNNRAAFNRWFKWIIAKSPLVASYLISLPMTGGYYGFLNLYYDDGSRISNAQLKLNYNSFHALKDGASGYVRDSKIRLKAVEGCKLLQLSLDCVYRQGGMNPTTLQKAKFCLYAYFVVPVKKRFGGGKTAAA